MSYRPFRNIGRSVLAASAVSLVSLSLSAQTAPSTTAVTGPNPSRVDVFLGYSYMGNHGTVKPAGIKYSSVDKGAIASGAYYFNKYVGAEGIFIANPDGQNDGFWGGYAGPIFRAPMQNFTLFAHGLAGGVKVGGPNNEIPATVEHEPYTWGASVMAGGGMDYDLPFLNHRFGLRLFEADYRYIHASFGPSVPVPTQGTLGGRANIGAAELSTGLLIHFGSILPPTPVAYACSVTAPTGTIYPGDVVTVTGTATNLAPKKDPAYTWSGDGLTATGTSNVTSIDTKSLAPGTYTVKGHVSQGNKPYQIADCSTTFTVTPFAPPTVGCSANPSTVSPGDSSTITAAGVSPQNRPLTYSYSSTAGSISGNTSTATLSTAGAGAGTISVTCNVVDDKGQTASQMTSVTVVAPKKMEEAPKPVAKSLCTISFDKDMKRPARVDNEAKACLDDIALSAQRDPQAKLIIAGSSAPVEVKHGKHHEDMGMHRAAERAVNEKEYLVNDKGLDASRISVYTGSTGTNTSAATIVPAGATPDMTGLTPVDEMKVKAIPRTAPVKAKKHHKK